MNTALRARLTQFNLQFQREWVPLVEVDLGQPLTPKLTQLLRIWERVEIERFVLPAHGWFGRPRRERAALARAFVAKAVLGLTETSALVERLASDSTLRRLCGFDLRRAPPNESLFCRAFAEFTAQGLPAKVHEALVRGQLGDALVGHLSRDATAIDARERPQKAEPKPAPSPRKRGRPRKGDVAPAPPKTRLQRQADGQDVVAMLAELPKHCDVGTKRNSKGYKTSWVGYKLHLDVADGMLPISAVLTSAGVHDSQVAIPLATLSAQRVTSLYDPRLRGGRL